MRAGSPLDPVRGGSGARALAWAGRSRPRSRRQRRADRPGRPARRASTETSDRSHSRRSRVRRVSGRPCPTPLRRRESRRVPRCRVPGGRRSCRPPRAAFPALGPKEHRSRIAEPPADRVPAVEREDGPTIGAGAAVARRARACARPPVAPSARTSTSAAVRAAPAAREVTLVPVEAVREVVMAGTVGGASNRPAMRG